MLTKALLLLLLYVVVGCSFAKIAKKNGSKQVETKFYEDRSIILLATLKGDLVAMCRRTGEIKWMIEEEPVVRLSRGRLGQQELFLPNPRDGSLYTVGSGGLDDLVKADLTIAQLVADSQHHSYDGLLHVGNKVDLWFYVDPITGRKQDTISFQPHQQQAQRSNFSQTDFILMGRTEYSLAIYDSETRENLWDLTFLDYASASSPTGELDANTDPAQTHDQTYLTTSSTGHIISVDKVTERVIWQIDLFSPVIGVYELVHDSGSMLRLLAVPFTTMEVDAVHRLLHRDSRVQTLQDLFLTLNIGQSEFGRYALPSLTDEKQDSDRSQKARSPPNKLGRPSPAKSAESSRPGDLSSPAVEIIVPEQAEQSTSLMDESVVDEGVAGTEGRGAFAWFAAAVVVAVIGHNVYWAWLNWKSTEDEQEQQEQQVADEVPEQAAPLADAVLPAAPVVSETVVLESGFVQVGKVQFNPSHLLGKGCEGTFVYRGRYDDRDVAIKRLLPESFTVADREVALLRQSDAHPNVVRYYCTEQDRQFKYIVLELCVATLQDYVEGRYNGVPIEGRVVLHQATAGLAHLHSLDIVHRDVKPVNVLISAPNQRGEVRAMISDFGLCTKLKTGRMSFSAEDGLAGTDGWVAPEMMVFDGERARTTCAVDIFSLGLVYYYVYSKGGHPFGDTLLRQANIVNNQFDLSPLPTYSAAYTLIEKMISADPLERPPARAILAHPIFWRREKILAFFQDVSDRVDKDSTDSAVLQCLERAANEVVDGNWKARVEEIVMADLRKHRTYQGRSVRDLLRALRNKKNHYREVSMEVRRIMGRMPDEFCDYWTSRFPKLLMHTWYAIHCVKNEHIFSHYYDSQYDFIQKPSVSWSPSRKSSIVTRILETELVDCLTGSSTTGSSSGAPSVASSERLSGLEIPSAAAAGPSSDAAASGMAEGTSDDVPDCWEASGAEAQEQVELRPSVNKEEHGDSGIVLSPGGYWGKTLERSLTFQRLTISTVKEVAGGSSAYSGAGTEWRLPSANQPWKISELEHYGRLKKRASKQRKENALKEQQNLFRPI